MNFVSIDFIVFILGLFLIYFVVPKKIQWIVLLIGSYTFFYLTSAKLIVFAIITSMVSFISGIVLNRINHVTTEYLAANKKDMSKDEKKLYKKRQARKKKWIVAFAVIINLGILVVLKYGAFIGGNLNSVLEIFGLHINVPNLNYLLPIGISFYTLQSIGYVVDMYRNKYEADKNFFKFSLFMTYFPQIIQGPIARYDQLAKQLYEGHSFDYSRVTQGAQLILWGFMKKLLVADRLSIMVNEIFNNYTEYEGIIYLIAGIAYGMQVYCDFSGGMDIARGVSQIFGIELSLNFERPYFAKSISEFWRRWHISLGSWMRDYIFYPLSLSKFFGTLSKFTRKILGNYIGKKLPTFLSMFIVFLLVGVWHGSSWKYVVYGLWNGIIIVTSILLDPYYDKWLKKLNIKTDCFSWGFFQMLRTFFLCSLGRLFPRAGSCTIAIDMFTGIFKKFNPWVLFDGTIFSLGLDLSDFVILGIMVIILLAVGILQERGMHIRETIAQQNLYFRWVVYLGAIAFLVVYGVYGPGYSATEFIYKQF